MTLLPLDGDDLTLVLRKKGPLRGYFLRDLDLHEADLAGMDFAGSLLHNVNLTAANLNGGTRYLRYLANMFGGDMVLTISGYHAGEGAVIKYNGVPPYSSTHGYIKKVLKFYHYYKRKQKNPS